MKKHRKDREKQKRSRKVIMFSSILIVCLFSAGYAAFSSNFVVSGKGTIVGPQPGSCFTVSDNGDGTGSITDYDINCGVNVWIPNKINGLTITKIADGTGVGEQVSGPFTRKKVETVILPDDLTYIGRVAFFQSNLKKLELPSSIKTIKAQAFAFTGLKEVKLNEGLETIEQEAFTSTNITELKIPVTVKNTTIAIATANLMDGENAFVYAKNKDGETDYSILNSYGNRNSTEIIFPSNIKTLGSLSIYLLRDMEILNIPDTVENLNYKFIYNMEKLKTINIGSGIKNIDENALVGLNYFDNHLTININRKENAIAGAPWGATNVTINWTGTK